MPKVSASSVNHYIFETSWLSLALLVVLLISRLLAPNDSAHITPVEETTLSLFLNRMENTIIQNT